MPGLGSSSTSWRFFRFASIVYVVMALGGLGAVHFWGHGLGSLTRIPPWMNHWQAWTGGVLVACIMLVASAMFAEWFDSFRGMKQMMAALLGDLPWWALIWIALCSAAGEELVFRAAIQPVLGIGVTSVIFGLMHIGPERRIGAWTIWAMGAGVLLGWVFKQTGSIGPVILAHFLVNAWSLLRIRYAGIEE